MTLTTRRAWISDAVEAARRLEKTWKEGEKSALSRGDVRAAFWYAENARRERYFIDKIESNMTESRNNDERTNKRDAIDNG